MYAYLLRLSLNSLKGLERDHQIMLMFADAGGSAPSNLPRGSGLRPPSTFRFCKPNATRSNKEFSPHHCERLLFLACTPAAAAAATAVRPPARPPALTSAHPDQQCIPPPADQRTPTNSHPATHTKQCTNKTYQLLRVVFWISSSRDFVGSGERF